jgi:galactose mutarotase-like enzyme
MAPFAGRVRDGQFRFRGESFQLPLDLPPHAIHGTVYRQPWTIVDDATIAIRLGDPWPFPGTVVQRFSLESDSMRVTMSLRAEQPMPASIGWHPWFRRRLTESGDDVDVQFDAELMFERDATGSRPAGWSGRPNGHGTTASPVFVPTRSCGGGTTWS